MSNPNIKNYGFGTRPKEVDAEYRSRGWAINKTKPRIWTDEKIAEFIDEMLTIYKKILMDDKKIEEGKPGRLKQETIRDMNTMLNKLLLFKEKYYPVTQKSLNVNIDMELQDIINRWQNKKVRDKVYDIEPVQIK
jgi:hypothetical protein